MELDDALIRVGIPRDLVKVLGVESRSDSQAGAFTRAFLNNNMRQDSRNDAKMLLAHKAVILDYCRPKKDKSKRKSRKAKGLNARQKRAMKVFHLKPEHQRYELFLPLHELWRQYVIDLCNGLSATCPQFVQQKLLKADFHGAILTVSPSRNLHSVVLRASQLYNGEVPSSEFMKRRLYLTGKTQTFHVFGFSVN
ncbi:ribonuclease P protein subunit p29-like isoform 4-T4 [Spinachia spinachia]